MLFAMELIFVARESNDGGYVARAPGHSIFTEAETWEELRGNVLEAASLHFEDATVRPSRIRLHLVKDELWSPLSLLRRSCRRCLRSFPRKNRSFIVPSSGRRARTLSE
jgi:predicted RNase H-like HicB family nuclease